MNQSESLEPRDHWDYLAKIKTKTEKINYVIKQLTALLHHSRFVETAWTVLQWNFRFATALDINVSSLFHFNEVVIQGLRSNQVFLQIYWTV